MADPLTTVTTPDLPALAQTDGSELVAVWRNGRLFKMPQRDLRGTKTFSGTTTPPYDPSRLFTMQVSLNDRWRNTTTRDEHKLTSLNPIVWEFDGNVGGGKGDPGAPGAGISPKGQFATTADLPAMGLPGDLYVATADDTANPPAFVAGEGAMYVVTGGTFGPGNKYRNIGPFRGPPGATTVDGLEDATDGFKALNVADPSAPGNPVGDALKSRTPFDPFSGTSSAKNFALGKRVLAQSAVEAPQFDLAGDSQATVLDHRGATTVPANRQFDVAYEGITVTVGDHAYFHVSNANITAAAGSSVTSNTRGPVSNITNNGGGTSSGAYFRAAAGVGCTGNVFGMKLGVETRPGVNVAEGIAISFDSVDGEPILAFAHLNCNKYYQETVPLTYCLVADVDVRFVQSFISFTDSGVGADFTRVINTAGNAYNVRITQAGAMVLASTMQAAGGVWAGGSGADGSMSLLRGTDNVPIGTWDLNNTAQSVTLNCAYSNGTLRLAVGNADRVSLTATDMSPATDGAVTLGTALKRFGTIYATNATIQTSDGTLKEGVRPFNDAERRVAVRLKDLLKIWKWKTGDRLHAGWIAQDVRDAFLAEKLDPAAYALWCSDPVTKTVERVVGKGARPVIDTVDVPEEQTVVENGRAIRKVVMVPRPVPRTVALPVTDEAGKPVTERVQDGWLVEPTPRIDGVRNADDSAWEVRPVAAVDGVPRIVERQVIHHEPVMEDYDVIELVQEPTGEVRLGLRMSETLAFALAALA